MKTKMTLYPELYPLKNASFPDFMFAPPIVNKPVSDGFEIRGKN